MAWDDGPPPVARVYHTAINFSGNSNVKDSDGNHSKGDDNSGKGNCNFVLLTQTGFFAFEQTQIVVSTFLDTFFVSAF